MAGTDTSDVDLAMHDRPSLKEVLGIVLACALLLVVLATLDNRAAREYQARAQKALSAQRSTPAKKADAPRPPRAIPAAPAWSARTTPTAEGGASTFLFIMVGCGLLMAASGALILGRSR